MMARVARPHLASPSSRDDDEAKTTSGGLEGALAESETEWAAVMRLRALSFLCNWSLARVGRGDAVPVRDGLACADRRLDLVLARPERKELVSEPEVLVFGRGCNDSTFRGVEVQN